MRDYTQYNLSSILYSLRTACTPCNRVQSAIARYDGYECMINTAPLHFIAVHL